MKRKITENQLKQLITNKVRKYLKESGTQRYGRKYYRDDNPELSKQNVRYGDAEIDSNEYDRLANKYDEDLGYHYNEPNPEPICYDPLDGLCYDTGDYTPNDSDLQDDYAKYADRQRLPQDTNQYVKRDQMISDFRDRYNETKPNYESNLDMNLNTYPTNGEWAMAALKGNKFAQNLKGTLRPSFDAMGAKLNETKLHNIISKAIKRVINEGRN